jgi:hypothetical protein
MFFLIGTFDHLGFWLGFREWFGGSGDGDFSTSSESVFSIGFLITISGRVTIVNVHHSSDAPFEFLDI